MKIETGLIALITLIAIFSLYKKIEYKRVTKIKKTTYLFFPLIILLSAFLFNPNIEIISWLLWSIFLYEVLDDWNTKSVNILGFLVILMVLVIIDFDWKKTIVVAAMFVFILIFGNAIKSVGVGDMYAFLPIIYYFSYESINIILLAIILNYMVVYLRTKRKEDMPFLPFLATSIVLSVWNDIIIVPFLLFYSFIYIFAICKKISKKYKK